MPVRRGMRTRMRGRGVRDVLRRIHKFIRGNQVISRSANALSTVLPAKYRGIASKVGGVAGVMGYGRRRGGALRLAGMGGGALRLSGGMRLHG